MIKSLSKFLNNRLFLHKQSFRFNAPKKEQQGAQLSQQAAQLGQQQAQHALQQGQVPGQQIAAEGQQVVDAEVQQDPFEGLTLLQSNWKQIAPLIHTTYSFMKDDPFLKRQVQKKLLQTEALFNLDINHLDKVKILDHREFDIRSSIYGAGDTNRYVQTNISQNHRVGYSMITGRKFRQMLDSSNITALKQLYRNNEFSMFVIQADAGAKIIDAVAENPKEKQFLLNLLECLRINDKEKLLVPNKNFDRVLQNIHDYEQVNKLKFFWRIYSSVENGPSFVNFNAITHELTKISFQGVDSTVSEKTVRSLYSAVLGKQAMKKLIVYSLEKYAQNFREFVHFWGLVNLLVARLNSLTEASLANPHGLNSVFNLFELNFSDSKDIVSQIIPEALHETKNKMLFEIYRVHAKFWIQRKADPRIHTVASPFDQFLNHKIDHEDSIQVIYTPSLTHSQILPSTKSALRTSKNTRRLFDFQDEILSQTKMIEHLIRGDYSFVLNHFLFVYNPGLQKERWTDMRNILAEAKQMKFTDENARALYTLKKINERFFYLSEPVAFRHEFLTEFKKIRWLERERNEPSRPRKTAQQKLMQQDEEGRVSKKRTMRMDPEDSDALPLDNKQRIYNKPKKQGALFSKKNKSLFSTQKDSYAEYRQVVKDLTQDTASQLGFNLDKNMDLPSFKQQVERKSREMTEKNHMALLTQTHLPIVGSGANLMKYLFLRPPTEQVHKIDEQLRKRLKVSFVSEIGALEKDFSQYLENNRFDFPLAEEVYLALLQDQKPNYVRKSFKTIVTHMIAYRKSLSDAQIQAICDIAKKNRIGITLVEIYNLLIQNRTVISRQAIYTFCDSLQKFKKINGDIFLMTKKYCENIAIPFEISMMSSYVKSLLLQQADQKLAQLCQTLKTQLKPKPYKVRPNLSAEQNLKLEKQHKQFQRQEYNRILNEIINMVVLNVNNKLPTFVSQLFDEYEKTQTKLQAKEIAISLIVYCNNVEKFLEIIRALKNEPEKIIPMTYECAIKAVRLNSRALEPNAEEIFNVALFTHNFMLNEDQIQRTVQILKNFNSPTVFIKFLQYILRYNPTVNYEIKNGMYFLMNNINDDFAKNTISGLLDFIYNSNREKEREEYRKAQIVEEEKAKLLQDLEKKEFFVDMTENQKAQVVEDIEKGNLEDAKKPKKNKNPEKEKVDKNLKEAEKKQDQKAKAEKPQSQKTERRRISLKAEETTLVTEGDPVLKKSNLKKKLRNKSLNDFEEMFTQKEENLSEETDAKGLKAKGQKLPQKDAKEAKNGKKKGK